MRKIAVVAILAFVAAMVPASMASSQPTPGSLDGVGTLMIINPVNPAAPNGGARDIWFKIGGDWQKLALNAPSKNEFQLPAADHSYIICVTQGSSDQTCSNTGNSVFSTGGVVHVESNDILNFLITSQGLANPLHTYIAENNTDKTETDHSQLTVFNATGLSVDVCVGDNHVISLPGGALNFQNVEFDAKDGEGQLLRVQVDSFPPGGPFVTCAGIGPGTDLGFPAGANTVVNLANVAAGESTGSEGGYQIFPGEEPPTTSQQVDAFCAVVLESANITPWLQGLFDEVEVGNEDTYPSSDKVEKVITRVAELLEKGNQTAPDDIRPVWLRATASFVETGRLAAVQYDIAELPQDDLRSLIDGVEHPGADDSEEAADTAALTAWVTTNCFGAIEAEPSFTG